VRVFERTRNGAALTEFGQLLAGHAAAIDSVLSRAADGVEAKKRGLEGSPIIGVSPVACVDIVPAAVARLKRTITKSRPIARRCARSVAHFSTCTMSCQTHHDLGSSSGFQLQREQGPICSPRNSMVFKTWPEAMRAHRTVFTNLSEYRLPVASVVLLRRKRADCPSS
jgi:hypothetical protein